MRSEEEIKKLYEAYDEASKKVSSYFYTINDSNPINYVLPPAITIDEFREACKKRNEAEQAWTKAMDEYRKQ